MPKLIAIDGNSLMHRAFYALPPMTTKNGVPTGAIHGFVSMLLKLIQSNPDYLVVAFDMHGPTRRHIKFPEYKAGRKATPDELVYQLEKIKELLQAAGISICQCEGYEADDILGTFAKMAAESGVEALLVTGDRDALQLVSDTTHVLMTRRGITDTIEYDPDELMQQYGLTPERMKDLKGLMGDNSDNIPGIPGVGEKTALKLLKEYGDIRSVLSHAHEIGGKLGEKLAEYGEQALLSRELGTIVTDVPVDVSLEECRFDLAALAGALQIMNELELRSLAARLPAAAAREAAPAPSKPAAVAPNIISITEMDGLNALAEELKKAEIIAVYTDDQELSIATSSELCYCIKCQGNLLERGLAVDDILSALKCVFGSETPKKLMFDAKRFMHLLDANGIELNGLLFDAMIADYLLNATHPAASLKTLAAERLNRTDGINASVLFELYYKMTDLLKSTGMLELYQNVELPLVTVLFDMEKSGFMIDADMLCQFESSLCKRLSELESEIYCISGQMFNILSPRQLGNILFEKLQLPPQKKTKTGYSTDSEVLEKLADKHPIVPLVLEYRSLMKLKGSFVDGLLKLRNKATGRIHTTLNQNVTATGRISSTEPNLQNIPVRTELGREIRKAFIASPGNVLVDADYSQIELRILAHISNDENMINAFLSGADIHTKTASEIFGVAESDVKPEQRSAAKAVNFGIVYGISDFGLSRNLNIPRRKAGEYIDLYFKRYPGIKSYLDKCVADARANGYAKTIMGRRRELPELKSSNYNARSFGERVAMNMPIQGTAADIIKLAMVRVHNALKECKLSAKLILQIHDELIIDAPINEAEQVKTLLSECMTGAITLSVPLVAEMHVGSNWYDAK